jgi:hypothetical protein
LGKTGFDNLSCHLIGFDEKPVLALERVIDIRQKYAVQLGYQHLEAAVRAMFPGIFQPVFATSTAKK